MDQGRNEPRIERVMYSLTDSAPMNIHGLALLRDKPTLHDMSQIARCVRHFGLYGIDGLLFDSPGHFDGKLWTANIERDNPQEPFRLYLRYSTKSAGGGTNLIPTRIWGLPSDKGYAAMLIQTEFGKDEPHAVMITRTDNPLAKDRKARETVYRDLRVMATHF